LRLRVRRKVLISRWALASLAFVAVVLLAGAGIFYHYWAGYGQMIDELLAGHVNRTAARIYAAPSQIFVGQVLSPSQLTDRLQAGGYTETQIPGATGWFNRQGNSVEIRPGENSYFAGKNALRVQFSGKQIGRIITLDNRSAADSAFIEPPLLTNLFDSSREKRRRVRFEDIPPVLVHAVLSAEDKRFFEHPTCAAIRWCRGPARSRCRWRAASF
jgi:penicillin-binding protein 1B